MEFVSKSPKETQKIAANLAQKIIKTKKAVDNRLAKSVIHSGAVIALEGELGAGKTTFIQGFAKALGIRSKIKSPTFVLMKKYKLETGNWKLETNLYHLDCYRVGSYKDLKIPEFKDIIQKPNNIVLIEWAERVREILPKKHITVHIDHISKNVRKIKIDNF